EKYRWIFAMRGVDMLLNDFHYSLDKKIEFTKHMSKTFLLEFTSQNGVEKQINDRYRTQAPFIKSFMNSENDQENAIVEGVEVFKARSAKMESIYIELQNRNYYEQMIWWLMPSYLHMFLNRLFTSNQRKQELV